MQNFVNSGLRQTSQITNDGANQTIYNGITDWLYEEEILQQTNALWWSPDSAYLAFIKFNDSMVDYFYFPSYDGAPYSNMNKVRYPKPDGKNPVAKVLVYDTNRKLSRELSVPKAVKQQFG